MSSPHERSKTILATATQIAAMIRARIQIALSVYGHHFPEAGLKQDGV
jgi:hypothetical protein